MLIEHEKEKTKLLLLKFRDLEYTLYATTFAGMKGEKVFKSIKKPTDLYLFPDEQPKKKLKGEIADQFMINMFK